MGESQADVLVRLADKLDVDFERAAFEKLEINATKYPAEDSRGGSKKYAEL